MYYSLIYSLLGVLAFNALTLLVGWQEGHPACKNLSGWGAGVVICLERGADMHVAQLMPLPLNVSCFSKIQIGFTFLVPADPGSPGKRAVKRVFVCVCVTWSRVFCVFKRLNTRTNSRPCTPSAVAAAGRRRGSTTNAALNAATVGVSSAAYVGSGAPRTVDFGSTLHVAGCV